jgi:uncharacterized lipoprotein
MQFGFLVMLLSGLYSCALSPQSIALQPILNVPAEPIGRNRLLAVEVMDQRPQQAFGARGGVYDTALIVPRTDVAQAIHTALTERLRASGFNITHWQPGMEPSLRVIIKHIDYVMNEAAIIGGPLINEVRVRAVIEAMVSNGGQSRNGEYQASNARRQVGYLTAADNVSILNEVVAQALQQLLQDRDILDLLTR